MCLCVCMLGTQLNCTKMAKPVEMLFMGRTHGPRNVLDRVQILSQEGTLLRQDSSPASLA